MGEFGFRHKKKLKADSVPSVFPKPSLNLQQDETRKDACKARQRGAFAKIKRRRVV